MNVLEVKNLTKKYGDFVAVNDISFSVKKGEILGFLGPNGAGKTTTLQMLLGVLLPTSGSIEYFGKELRKHRTEILEKVNFSSTYTNLPWLLTVKECLIYSSYLYEIKNRSQKVSEIVKLFKLEKIYNKKINELSAGQTTRVNLAKAFLNDPEILLLDEPTASLDPDIAIYIRNFLLEYRKKNNISIIITSHNMSEVTNLCDRVIFVSEGKILSNDTPQNLTKTITVSHLELFITEGEQKLEILCTEKKVKFRNEKSRFFIEINEDAIAQFLNELHESQIKYSEISIDKPTLEDYFLGIVTQ